MYQLKINLSELPTCSFTSEKAESTCKDGEKEEQGERAEDDETDAEAFSATGVTDETLARCPHREGDKGSHNVHAWKAAAGWADVHLGTFVGMMPLATADAETMLLSIRKSLNGHVLFSNILKTVGHNLPTIVSICSRRCRGKVLPGQAAPCFGRVHLAKLAGSRW